MGSHATQGMQLYIAYINEAYGLKHVICIQHICVNKNVDRKTPRRTMHIWDKNMLRCLWYLWRIWLGLLQYMKHLGQKLLPILRQVRYFEWLWVGTIPFIKTYRLNIIYLFYIWNEYNWVGYGVWINVIYDWDMVQHIEDIRICLDVVLNHICVWEYVCVFAIMQH